MSDETPREPFPETPAPEHRDGEVRPSGAGYGEHPSAEWPPEHPSPEGPHEQPAPAPPGSVRQGVRVMLLIIAGMMVLELILYGAARGLDGTRWQESFSSSQGLVWLGGLIAGVVALVKLPPRSRTAFLASCGILFGAVFTLLIITCGILLMNA